MRRGVRAVLCCPGGTISHCCGRKFLQRSSLSHCHCYVWRLCHTSSCNRTVHFCDRHHHRGRSFRWLFAAVGGLGRVAISPRIHDAVGHVGSQSSESRGAIHRSQVRVRVVCRWLTSRMDRDVVFLTSLSAHVSWHSQKRSCHCHAQCRTPNKKKGVREVHWVHGV